MKMNITGAIFDMDGTLVDSLMCWDVLWQRLGKKYLEQAAKNGDPKAMFNLGCCYAKFNGLNFPVFSFSRPLAVRWLRKAKEKGISLAEEKLRELGE